MQTRGLNGSNKKKEIIKIQAENKAAMEAAEELHRKKLAQDRQGEMEEDTEVKDDPMARAEADALSHDNNNNPQ